MPAEVVLYAPNVHTGGGFVLLQALLGAWPSAAPLRLFLDARVEGRLAVPEGASVYWVRPQALARLAGEFAARRAAEAGSILFCFHGLPPVLPSRARVVVFLQNRNYLGGIKLSQFPLKTRLRLMFERSIGRLFRHRVAEYVVQTPTMRRAVLDWLGEPAQSPMVRISPFAGSMPAHAVPDGRETIRWDFVYVADGVAHKNHRRLVQAWALLAEKGLYPSLAVTLGPRDESLAAELLAIAAKHGLRIDNQGELSREDVSRLYAQAGALVFPSFGESFGLPLIEASKAGLPIVASELDYVRDVCVPAQTFDPGSAVSIARAVRRQLGQESGPAEPVSPEQFWSMLRGSGPQASID
ncbi:glycosyltransferase [Achromobacter seleniivolatilans]|uniref:Glycosyltransferase n=1 Tax=Achromobacter seleniivolatilans TaxID=3047478 RepID=A0ABY9LY37_9BURK|nr:glycosyltransferase [Achromobacter sp. R39]WMD19375.1 glycosyltransferase [Achromobacter sp. R39]